MYSVLQNEMISAQKCRYFMYMKYFQKVAVTR